METDVQTVIDCIRKIAGNFQKMPTRLLVCEVITVDESAKTCKAKPVNGDTDTEIAGIKLSVNNNNGFYQVPAPESNILVGVTETKDYFCIMCEDITDMVIVIDDNNHLRYDGTGWKFNDGLNGGLINIIQQTAKLNQLVAELQAQLALIATGIAGAGGTYTPGVLSTFVKADYEDLKIKH